MRVFQPLPVVRNDSTISRDKRMVRSLATAARGWSTRFNFANSASASGKASESDIAAFSFGVGTYAFCLIWS